MCVNLQSVRYKKSYNVSINAHQVRDNILS